MKSKILQLAVHVLVLWAMSASAAIRYVNVDSARPAPPYNNWTIAAATIQDAVDAAVAGDQILVTNGVYQTGGRAVVGMGTTNRVAVTKPVTIESVNGAAVTLIQGSHIMRCVYLTNDVVLVGFTLTNGVADYGGGVRCESASAVLSNCVLAGNSGGGASGGTLNNCTLTANSAVEFGGGAMFCTLNNCVLTGNSAYVGGGSYGGTLNKCTLSGNSARSGGGAIAATLENCTLTGNSASFSAGGALDCTLNNCTLTGNSGGGASACTLNNCTLTGNSDGGASACTLNNCTLTSNRALSGGGADSSTLNNCTLTGNGALIGGGAAQSRLNNCVLTGNSAGESGGGAFVCTLNNCTLIGNSASLSGGGVQNCTLNNCIAYYNNASNGWNAGNCSDSFLSYSCTTPLPPGLGNISAEPQLADLSHLSAGSPCRGAGNAAYATGVDIDGETWANPPSIGCDEYYPSVATGPLNVSIQAAYTNVAVGFALHFMATIDGRATANRCEFGDGTAVSNRISAPHSWAVAGDYSVVFRAYNGTYPDGVSATVTVHVVAQPVHYVALGSADPVAPYTSWATAATNLQDAVDVVSAAGALVLVTNGVYQSGGREAFGGIETTNRVAVNKPVTVRSVNGAAVTVIRGFQVPGTTNGDSAIRCVYLSNGAALVGFTLTNGATRGSDDNESEQSGGGVWCESANAVVANCVLNGNSAGSGGGAYGGTLNNCVLTGNSAGCGGGAENCTLNNCVLSGNSAAQGGGGTAESTLNNCTLSSNSALYGPGGAVGGTLNNCILFHNTQKAVCEDGCDSTPGRLMDGNNWSGNPLFVDQAGGNLRLQSNSPCINAGSNAFAPASPDLDGNPRIAGGTVDIGAYEFQSPRSLISYAWLQQYSLPIDGSADNTDADGDGLNNWQEWRAGTNPTNPLSVLRLLSPASGATGLIVSWQSVSGLNYILERGADVGAQPPFLPLATNIVGQPGTTTFTDTNVIGARPFFYRVGVQE